MLQILNSLLYMDVHTFCLNRPLRPWQSHCDPPCLYQQDLLVQQGLHLVLP